MAKESNTPKPWSDDPVFQSTYFCNVRREDDRVTKWIRQNWGPLQIGWEDYEYAMLLSRFLNWPDTLSVLRPHIADFEAVGEIMSEISSRGEKVWGNAYVITTHGIKMPKATYLCERVLPAAYELLGGGRWRTAYQRQPTLQARHEQLLALEGVGDFLSAQILADLKNTVGHPLASAKDWHTWAAPGPGSLRGLKWFFGESTPGMFQSQLDFVRSYVNDRTGLYLHAQDVQNCLCEYDKFMRVKNGTGRSKRNYNGLV